MLTEVIGFFIIPAAAALGARRAALTFSEERTKKAPAGMQNKGRMSQRIKKMTASADSGVKSLERNFSAPLIVDKVYKLLRWFNAPGSKYTSPWNLASAIPDF
jgi:hypothetical protein